MAREVGIEGKLGGQAKVPGAAGTWRDLTDNVNQLAANLTTQVRAIAEVATAVTKGDLTRSITVEAQGEVAALKDNINQMIRNLQGHDAEEHRSRTGSRPTWRKFTAHAAGPARPRARSSQADPVRADAAGRRAARRLLHDRRRGRRAPCSSSLVELRLPASASSLANRFKLGEGLVGQCALEKKRILLDRRAARLHPRSARASARRRRVNIIVLPVLFEGEVKAVIELASFDALQRRSTWRSSTS